MKFRLNTTFLPQGDQPQAIKSIVEGFEQNKKFQTLLGVTGSGKTFTIANVIEKIQKKTLVMAPNKTLAAQLYGEFREFFPDNAVEYFISYYDYYQPEAYVPGTDTYIEKDSAINDEIDKLRHSATRSLLERDDVIVVASVSCIYGIGSPVEYGGQKIHIKCGQKITINDFLKKIVVAQYQRSDDQFQRGKFRRRGDVVEVFPSYDDQYYLRIEFFENEVERIWLVEHFSSIKIKSYQETYLYPSSHYVVGPERMEMAKKSIQTELRQRLQWFSENGKELEYRRLSQRTLLDLEMMEELGFCPGIENYSRHLSGAKPGEAPPTLIDFFNKDFLLVLDESHITVPQVGGMYRGDRSRKQTLVDHGFRLPSALDNRPLNFEEFETKYQQVLFVSATPSDYELNHCTGEIVEQIIRPTGLLDPVIEVSSAENQVAYFLEEAKKCIEKNQRALVTTLTKKMSEDLTKYYKEKGLKVQYMHSDIDSLERLTIINQLRLGKIDILVGINLLREGLDLPEVSLVGIMDADKEGFLRSTRSLIQTIGRAARNIDGRVILFGYKITKSMQEAIDITKNRRNVQALYNEKNRIIPSGINKKISGGVLETLRGPDHVKKDLPFSYTGDYKYSANELDRLILSLKEEMKKSSDSRNFEQAAKLREQIKYFTEMRLLL